MTTKTQDSMAVGTNETLDTIVAISTPPGRGGIGVVRLAGPSAIEVAERLVRVKHSLRAPEAHGRAYFCRVVDPEGYGWGDSRPAHDDEAVMNGAPGKSGSAGMTNKKKTKKEETWEIIGRRSTMRSSPCSMRHGAIPGTTWWRLLRMGRR
jgi:hypothetical protein